MQTGDRVVRGQVDEMGKMAKEMAKLAKAYAPVDEMNLERAIKVSRKISAANRRVEYAIYVSKRVVARNRKSGGATKYVKDYAYLIHNEMEPWGVRFRRGPKSEAKDGGRNVVGGGFITRAVETLEEKLFTRLKSRLAVDIRRRGDVLEAADGYDMEE